MSPHELNSLHIVHVFSVVAMLALTFYGFAGAPATRKKVLAGSGIAALLVLATGLRMWQGFYGLAAEHEGWIYVKLVCWLALAALGGIGYRRREQAGLFMAVLLALVATALAMVYVRPF